MGPAVDPRPVIVKLGGSVLTRERQAERRRPKVVTRLGRELADPPVPGLLVVHGAGSFGRPGVNRFRLAAAPDPSASVAERARGGAIVAREIRRLHGEVLRSLLDGGAPAFSLPPFGRVRNLAGRAGQLNVDPFLSALRAGLVAVTFEDVVDDDAWGLSILSADELALELGRRLNAERVVFVSDVPGILPPSGEGRAVPIRRLTPDRLDTGFADRTRNAGLRRKLEAMLELARSGIPAGLVSGLSDGAVGRSLRGPVGEGGSWALPSSAGETPP